jgi:hypothetical protein
MKKCMKANCLCIGWVIHVIFLVVFTSLFSFIFHLFSFSFLVSRSGPPSATTTHLLYQDPPLKDPYSYTASTMQPFNTTMSPSTVTVPVQDKYSNYPDDGHINGINGNYNNDSGSGSGGDGKLLAYPEKLSLEWKVAHSTLYVTGGIAFFVGSFYYFPAYTNYLAGAWWYIIGSVCFFIADIIDWWTNNRAGCCMDAQYTKDFESQCMARNYPGPETTRGKWLRMEVGLNFALSAMGSFVYIIGSAMLIPVVGMNDGDILYIWASLCIMIAQVWKFIRQGEVYRIEIPSNV